jgi:hypothetical protein
MHLRSTISVVVALAVAGCAARATETPEPPPATQATAGANAAQPEHATHAGHAGMKGSCPMMVEGTTVRAEDVEGGASLVFTTTGDVAELRSRVHQHAEKMASGACPMMHEAVR